MYIYPKKKKVYKRTTKIRGKNTEIYKTQTGISQGLDIWILCPSGGKKKKKRSCLWFKNYSASLSMAGAKSTICILVNTHFSPAIPHKNRQFIYIIYNGL